MATLDTGFCPNIGSCTDYRNLIFDFALDFRALCILGSGISLNKWSLLRVGFTLDTRGPAPSYLASPTNRVKHRLSDTQDDMKGACCIFLVNT